MIFADEVPGHDDDIRGLIRHRSDETLVISAEFRAVQIGKLDDAKALKAVRKTVGRQGVSGDRQPVFSQQEQGGADNEQGRHQLYQDVSRPFSAH